MWKFRVLVSLNASAHKQFLLCFCKIFCSLFLQTFVFFQLEETWLPSSGCLWNRGKDDLLPSLTLLFHFTYSFILISASPFSNFLLGSFLFQGLPLAIMNWFDCNFAEFSVEGTSPSGLGVLVPEGSRNFIFYSQIWHAAIAPFIRLCSK